jgi:hypothetical protein
MKIWFPNLSSIERERNRNEDGRKCGHKTRRAHKEQGFEANGNTYSYLAQEVKYRLCRQGRRMGLFMRAARCNTVNQCHHICVVAYIPRIRRAWLKKKN